jgi:hypothetical protein
MTTNAKTNFGQRLEMGDNVGSLVAIAELIEVTPPTLSRNFTDVTTHDSAKDADGGVPQEFIPDEIYDPGEMSFRINYVEGSTPTEALITAYGTRALKLFRLIGKGATGERFTMGYAYISSFAPDARPVNGVQTASITLRRSGVWTRGAVAA